PHTASNLICQPHGGVHRYRNGHQLGGTHSGLIQRLDRSVDGRGCEAGGSKRRQGRRQAERLVPELVTGNEQHLARASHFLAAGAPPLVAPPFTLSGSNSAGILASGAKKNSSI